MKKTLCVMMLAAMFPLSPMAQAHPGEPGWGWGRPGPEPWHRPEFHPGYRVNVLPGLATALIIGGLTYYVANGIYYQRQQDHYVVVQAPPSTVVVNSPVPDGNLRVLDFNGRRYYVSEGHYYQRDINGQYLEVPRPAGL